VSDAERDAVVTELGEHFGQGRLDQAEFDERVTRALSARTGRDIGGLLADLPPVREESSVPQPRHAASAPAHPGAAAGRSDPDRRSHRRRVGVLAAVVASPDHAVVVRLVGPQLAQPAVAVTGARRPGPPGPAAMSCRQAQG
jgi:hypothetical protein